MINYHTDTSNLKKMNDKEIKESLTNILISFASFCEKNNLRYALAWGTLLGCIRHEGFIPWDDDIDVIMPREDYEKLKKLVEVDDYTIEKDYYKLSTPNNKYSVHMPLYRIIDMRTITDSKKRAKKYWLPLWIDIMPCDHVPNDNTVIKNAVEKFYKNIAHMSFAIYNSNRSMNIVKRAIGKIEEPFMDHFINKYDQQNTKLGKETDGYFDFSTEIDRPKDGNFLQYIYNRDIFDTTIIKSFEGHKVRVPKEYDKILTILYGDYMKLPPEDQRVSHSNGAYWLKEGELYGTKH